MLGVRLVNVRGSQSFAFLYSRKNDTTVNQSIIEMKETKCPFCPIVYDNTKSLWLHYKAKHPNQKLECRTCLKVFKLLNPYMIHQETVHGNKSEELHCNICQQTFPIIAELNAHVTKVHVDLKLKCEQCDKTYRSIYKLREHRNAKHSEGTSNVICDYCHKCFTSETGLKTHIRLVHYEREAESFKCYECSKTFDAKTKLIRHIETHHVESPTQCMVCLRTFLNDIKLKNHMLIHKKPTSVPIECNICCKSMDNEKLLRVHVRNVHEKAEKSCKFCHMKTCTVEKGKTICSICDKVFKSCDSMKTHVTLVHSGKTWPCKICEKVCCQKSALNIHIEKVHGNVRHQCNVCKRMYTAKSGLHQHIKRVHQGKRFACKL